MMVFHWKRGRREMEHEQVRGWRGGLGDKGEEGQRKEGVKSGLENKGEVGQR